MRSVLSQTSEAGFICHCIKSPLQVHKFQFSLGKVRLLMTVGAVRVDSNIITQMSDGIWEHRELVLTCTFFRQHKREKNH